MYGVYGYLDIHISLYIVYIHFHVSLIGGENHGRGKQFNASDENVLFDTHAICYANRKYLILTPKGCLRLVWQDLSPHCMELEHGIVVIGLYFQNMQSKLNFTA